MSLSVIVLACTVVEAMSISSPRNSYAGIPDPRDHLRSPLLELYRRSLKTEAKKKLATELLPAFGGLPALVTELNRRSKETRKRKLASDNQLQHDPKAA
jgi:hypothetical protein